MNRPLETLLQSLIARSLQQAGPLNAESYLARYLVTLSSSHRSGFTEAADPVKQELKRLAELGPQHPLFAAPTNLFAFTVCLQQNGLKEKDIFLKSCIHLVENLDSAKLCSYFGRWTYDTLYGIISLDSFGASLDGFEMHRTKLARLCLDHVIACLTPTSHGVSFPRLHRWVPGEDFFSRRPTQEIDLGLAHGIGGILLFLCRNNGLLSSDEKGLWRSQLDLLSNLNEKISQETGYPASTEDLKPQRKVTNGWCYGDISVGWTLSRCAHELNDQKLQNKGLEILTRGLKRQVGESNDIFFCHGLAGAILISQKASEFKDLQGRNPISLLRLQLLHKLMLKLQEGIQEQAHISFLDGPPGLIYVLESVSGIKHPAVENYFLIN